jgi:AraC family transcriptional regulator of adaptative response / DNA-3-methyladenine glycosylase II
MKRRDVEITHKDGRFHVLRSCGPLSLDLAKMAREANYQMPALCAQIGLSERHLRRLFAEGLGISPKDWLRQQRMVMARPMLRSGMPVKEAAFELGFATSRMFSRDFVEFYGVPPSVFQRLELTRMRMVLERHRGPQARVPA